MAKLGLPLRIKIRRSVSVMVLGYGLLFLPTCIAGLILTAPPRETPQAGHAVYDPLARYLTKFLGEKVVYEHPGDWKHYESKMKNDEYDIIFDGPHFAAWRIDSLMAQPLIKLPGSLRFVLVVKNSDQHTTQTRDLIGKTICTLPPPNLGALTLFSMFPHPARQPKYRLVKGGFKQVMLAFEAGLCKAAILRSSFYYKKTEPLFRDITRVIRHSKGLTNQGITVSRRIKPEVRKKMAESLLKGEGKTALKPILERFYSQANAFIPAQKRDYRNQNLLRDTTIFGWE